MNKLLQSSAKEGRRNALFLVLCGIFLTNAILAELVGVKIFSAEATLGLPYAHLPC